jgi:hypothetical protein
MHLGRVHAGELDTGRPRLRFHSLIGSGISPPRILPLTTSEGFRSGVEP